PVLWCYLSITRSPYSTLYPYTTLFRSTQNDLERREGHLHHGGGEGGPPDGPSRGRVSQRDAVGLQPRQRVDLHTVLVHLEVQVRAGGLTAVTHRRDLLAGLHALADGHQGLVDVSVHGDQAVVVLDPDPQSEAAGGTGRDHRARHDRVDGGADRVGDVDAVVGAAPPRAVAGGERTLRGLHDTARRRRGGGSAADGLLLLGLLLVQFVQFGLSLVLLGDGLLMRLLCVVEGLLGLGHVPLGLGHRVLRLRGDVTLGVDVLLHRVGDVGAQEGEDR